MTGSFHIALQGELTILLILCTVISQIVNRNIAHHKINMRMGKTSQVVPCLRQIETTTQFIKLVIGMTIPAI